MSHHAQWIPYLEGRFRHLSELLYDTSIDPARADAEITPMLADDVRFTDPWQTGTGRAKYRLGIAGFHAMFRFRLEIDQVSVQLSSDNATARVLIDGVMNLQPFGPVYTYPLRTILRYDLQLKEGPGDLPDIVITAHEEMWSLGDMLAAMPLGGRFYDRVFRPGFARGFLAASWLSAKARGMLPDVR